MSSISKVGDHVVFAPEVPGPELTLTGFMYACVVNGWAMLGRLKADKRTNPNGQS